MTEVADTDSPNVDWAERRAERAAQRKASSRSRTVWIWLGALAGVLLLLVLAEVAFSAGRIHPGVTVSGVEVGGLTPTRAAVLLEARLPGAAEEPVVVYHRDKTWEIAASKVGLGFDYPATIERAMAVGRTGGVSGYLGGRLGAWFGGVDVVPVATSDPVRMDETLSVIAKGTDVAPVDAKVVVDGTEVSVEPPADGVALVRERAAAAIVAGYTSAKRRIEAPVAVAAPAVSAEDAEQAAAIAEQMIAEPVTVTYDKKEWTFKPAEVASWVSFRRSDEPAEGEEETEESTPSAPAASASTSVGASDTVSLIPFISAKAAAKDILPAVGTGVGRPAKDARFKTAAGRVTIIPSQNGIGPDIESLALSLTGNLATPEGSRSVELRTHTTQPELTTEKARAMGVEERISTYTTTYESGNAPRVNNIHLLGDKLDGTLLAPGETFSFNGTVGERTAAAGYREANAIVNGKLVPQLGGGICQVGTTLFNAVFESGFPVVERRNHSFYISHYPKGRDATVSWGGPDLKFKNDTKDWVLISVSYSSSSITISLYGTDPGYEVTSKTGSWYNDRKYPTETIKDPSMYVGTKIVEDGGISGRSIKVERVVKKDGKVVRTDSFVSNYKPKTEVVRVGTKPKPTSKPTTQTP